MTEKLISSAMLVSTNQFIDKLTKFAESIQTEFTEYKKTCVVNAMRAIFQTVTTAGYTLDSFDIENKVQVLQQVAFLELNPSAVPRECCFIVRKNWDNKNKVYLPPTLEFQIEGAGNDRILRKFGQDVKDFKSYIVYEGDEFTPGSFDGWDVVLPKYKRTFKTNNPEKVVYLIKKTNEEIDVQYADLNDVKKSLLASARQNGADEKLLRELNKYSLTELLSNEKWLDYQIVKQFKQSNGEMREIKTPLFNPSYTSPVSMGNMIERKLRNHATRKYPKNFNNKEVSELYEETFKEEKLPEIEKLSAEERIGIAGNEFSEGNGKEIIPNIVPKVEDARPKIEVPTISEPNAEEPKELLKETEDPKEANKETGVDNNDEPDWDN